MIIILLVLSMLLFAGVMIFMKIGRARQIWIGISAIFILFCLSGIMANDLTGYGMKEVTTVKQQALVSSTPQLDNVLLYKTLGTAKKERIYLYRTASDQKKPTSTQTADTTNRVERVNGSSQLVVQTTRTVYRNGFFEALFAITGENNRFVKRVNVFQVSSDWTIENIGK